jgi:hypothetical protein
MAVELSSDFVIDVMRNADPAQKRLAEARLLALGNEFQDSFSEILKSSSDTSALELGEAIPSLTGQSTDSTMAGLRNSKPYEAFEQLVLRNLVETLMPDTESGAFGDGPSSGIWRSMAADQLASVYSKAGGIGIADMLLPENGSDQLRGEQQWPYFSVGSIKSFSG